MQGDNILYKNRVLYFLEPFSDQILSIAKLLKEVSTDIELVALPLESEKYIQNNVYKKHIRIKNYHDSLFFGEVVPGGARSTEALLKVGNIKLGEVHLNQDVLRAYNKNWFFDLCNDNNLPLPTTYIDLREICVSDYPIFYKQKHEKGGGCRGVAFEKSYVPLNEVDDLVFQEFIDSQGTYGVGFLAKSGKVIVSHSHFEVESFPREGGSAVIAERIVDSRLLELTERIVGLLQYSGWGLAEYKYCPKRKDFVFMEVNAKFWASCEMALRNEPGFLKHLFGVQKEKEDIERLVFVNRAFRRGPSFWVRYLQEILLSKKIVYPGMVKSFLYGLTPSALIRYFRRYK